MLFILSQWYLRTLTHTHIFMFAHFMCFSMLKSMLQYAKPFKDLRTTVQITTMVRGDGSDDYHQFHDANDDNDGDDDSIRPTRMITAVDFNRMKSIHIIDTANIRTKFFA